MGGQVQMRLRSPWLLFTRRTAGQNLRIAVAGDGYAAVSRE